MQLYDKIVNLASARNLTIKELEFRAGFANGTIRRWNFSDPGISRVQTIANILGVDIGQIIYDSAYSDMNQKRFVLYKDKRLWETNYNDSYFGISDNIRGYDKVRYNYTFNDRNGTIITPQTIFIFENPENFKTFYLGVPRENSIYLIRYMTINHYIVRVKKIIGIENSVCFVGESLDPEDPLIPLYDKNIEILSQCTNILYPVY